MTMTTLDSAVASPSSAGKTRLWRGAILILLSAVLVALLAIFRADAQSFVGWLRQLGSASTLRWLAAFLPGCIILNHVIYLGTSRRKQFRQALGRLDPTSLADLENLYFGIVPLTIRYVIPAILVSGLTGTVIAALSNPGCYLAWLYTPASAAAPVFNTICTPDSLATTGISPIWPTGWAGQVLGGAALGFVGAYVYLLILLTDRARQRDVTTGIAIWAAAMPILGPMMGGIAALLIVSGTASQSGSFTQYAVYFVAGMLPRQFALFVQSGVSKIFQGNAQVSLRTLPLTMLRGVGPDVATRLEEEAIFDVSALAYASAHQLIRATTYAPRQIADWIDESLLITTVPSHWEALEKVGVTGAMDLAWYETRPDSIKPLADEIKMGESLLRDVVTRLWQDAQVQDLYKLYWDHTGPPPTVTHSKSQTGNAQETTVGDGVSLAYAFKAGIEQDARDRLIADVKTLPGVRSASIETNRVVVLVDPAQRDTVDAQLRTKPELDVAV